MPNHITNRIIFSGEDENIEKVLEIIRGEESGEKLVIDFNKIIPMPISLNIEASSNLDVGLKEYKRFIKSRDIRIISEDDFLKNETNISRSQWELGKQAWHNTVKYGSPTWYEWAKNNWGTKWNAYSQYYDENSMTLDFNTAWSCPLPILKKLALICYENDVSFTGAWADENVGYNAGRFSTQGKSLIYEYATDRSSEALEIYLELAGENHCIGEDNSGKLIIYNCDTCPNKNCC